MTMIDRWDTVSSFLLNDRIDSGDGCWMVELFVY